MEALQQPLTAAALPMATERALPPVWRGHELAEPAGAVTGSGHAALDRELPGGGWPQGQLTEVLQAQAGQHEWRLLVHPLRSAAQVGRLVLVGSPHWPNGPALAPLGLPMHQVLMVEASLPAERLWAAEQALRCEAVAALLVWLPQVRPEQLRRLQLAAQAQQRALVFVFRPPLAQHESSPAPLRVRLGLAPDEAGPGADHGVADLGDRLAVAGGSAPPLSLHILKRRGPPLDAPLSLSAPLPAWALAGRPWLRAKPHTGGVLPVDVSVAAATTTLTTATAPSRRAEGEVFSWQALQGGPAAALPQVSLFPSQQVSHVVDRLRFCTDAADQPVAAA